MKYHFEFDAVLAHSGQLAEGILTTISLSTAAVCLGTVIGIAISAIRWMRPGFTGRIVDAYVEVVRNTPFLVQLFILYFGLPALHFRVTATQAALIGMVINLGAYSAEIIRAGIDAIHRSQLEAGASLGMTPLQIFRHIVIKPAIVKVYPALSSQFVLMMLASSVTSAISTQELSSIAAQIDSETYRSFEVYIVVTLIYLSLAMLFKVALAMVARLFFGRRRARPLTSVSRPTATITGIAP